MRRALSVAMAAAMLLALPPMSSEPASAAVARRRVLSCDGCWPASFAFSPNGRNVWYVERFSGAIRVHNRRTGRDRVWARIGNLATDGEQGLLGIALDPRWPRIRWVYVYYTKASPVQNRILRLRRRSDGSIVRRRLASIPASSNHNGGVIHIGPDNRLYAVTGDAGSPSRSQDLSSRAGKVLRMRLNGRRPSDNPLPGLGYSYGHRNSFGFTFDPRTRRLWETENGPSCDDEVNWVRAGRNFGWGPESDTCGSTGRTTAVGPRPVRPSWVFNPVPAVTGAAFCQRCGLGRGVGGRLLIGTFNTGQIRRLRLNDRRSAIVSDRLLYDHPRGVLSLVRHPGGSIYFSDMNGIYRLVRG
ncbi:MAG: PQQ-dependent sugar dehydrogenase [Actinomycetota bacterium]|nr:PQQ-dependent sugar dehydrogenase [Actinomycetota bacterium]